MDQLTVVGRRSGARELLQSLQSLGVVQIDRLEPEEGAALARYRLEGVDREEADRWTAAVSRASNLRTALGAQSVRPAARSEIATDLDGIEAYLEDAGAQIDAVVSERTQATEEQEVVNTYLPLFRRLAPTLAQLEESRFLAAVPFLVAPDDLPSVQEGLEEALEGRVLVSTLPHGEMRLVTAVGLRREEGELRDALGRLGMAPLALPGRYRELGVAKAVHLMEERSQQLPKRFASLQGQLEKLAAQHGPKLAATEQVARNVQTRLAHLEDLAAGRYGYALRGWVPSADAKRVVDGLRKQFGDALVIDTRPADEHVDHDVPVKLDNPPWMRPFQGLLSLFAPPKYGHFDPTWSLALFFPLLFGIVVGDIAFGLLFLAVGSWLAARGRSGRDLSLGPLGIVLSARDLPGIGYVINWCAAWTIVFGAVYGEFFGNFLEHWPSGSPIFYPPSHGDHGLIPIALFRVEEFTPLLLITIGFGVLQVLLGWGIRAYMGIKHHDAKHFWEGLGMVSGLVGLVIFATAFLQNAVGPAVLTISGVLLALFLVSVVMSGLPLMLVELVSNSGHILSYLRIFAVGLSAALIANLGTDAGFATNEAIGAPVIGELMGILVAVVINLLAVVLTIIGHTLQPLRLQYVEFFTKFGFYDENGRPYRPFKLLGGKA